MIVWSLWRCPACLREKMPAFSLHAPFATRTRCPTCGYYMAAEIKPKAHKVIPPRIRKVAVIKLADPKMAGSVITPLNEAITAGHRPSIADHLFKLQEAGILEQAELTTRPDLL